MPTIEVTVQVRQDGEPLQGFPVTRRLEVDELQAYNYEKVADNDTTTFTALPADQLAEIQALVIQAGVQPITVRLDGQSDAGIVINAGGMIVLMDVDIDAGAGASNAKVNNPHATDASQVKGLAAGT